MRGITSQTNWLYSRRYEKTHNTNTEKKLDVTDAKLDTSPKNVTQLLHSHPLWLKKSTTLIVKQNRIM
jgi:hypothetical protein